MDKRHPEFDPRPFIQLERRLNFVQLLAALGLGLSGFLPFYASAMGEVRQAAGKWELFFWTFPVFVILHFTSPRWLKAIGCLFAALGGLLDLGLLTFAATFKSTPLVGYYLAQISLLTLVIGWLILGVILLRTAKIQRTKTRLQTQIEQLFLSGLLGGLILLVAYQLGWTMFVKAPAGELLDYKLPSGYSEVYSEYLLGFMHARTFEDFTPGNWKNGRPLIVIASMPAYLEIEPEKIRLEIQASLARSTGQPGADLQLVDETELTLRGQKVALFTYAGTDGQGAALKQVLCSFLADKQRKVILVITGEEEDWNQAEIDAFFESLK